MKIARVLIENFLTIGHSGWLNLQDRGLVLIQGENRDDPSATSNGAGKSSIVDAICWALYGETARGESGDAVVNLTAKKDCSVTVELIDGSVTYLITRNRKDSVNKNATIVMCGGLSMTRGTERETQKVIEGILGCSQEVFMSAIYAGQELMPDLPGMTDKQLKVLVEEAAGVSRLERAYEVARTKLVAKASELVAVVSDLTAVERQQAQAVVNLGKARERQKDFEDGRDERVKEFKDLAARVTVEAGVLMKQYKEIDVPGLTRNKCDLEAQLAGITTKGKEAADFYRATVEPVERHLTIARQEKAGVERTLNAAVADFKNATEALKKPCSECGKPHTEDELETFKTHKLAQIRVMKDGLVQADAKVQHFSEMLTEVRRQHNRLVDAIPDTSSLMGKISEIAKQLASAETIKFNVTDRVRQAKQALSDAEQKGVEANPYTAVVGDLDTELETVRTRLAELSAKRDSLNAEVEIAQRIVEVFSPAGVRAHILDTVTPFLNDRTARYLGTLSDGNITAVWSTLARTAKGELREKFGIEVTNLKGANSFKGLSGGEKRKVRLATMLALQDLVATRATKSIDLWIGDEIDHALDPSGLERLMTILDEKAREKGTVLIVSHNQLSDWCDQTATVVKEAGRSRVEGVLVE